MPVYPEEIKEIASSLLDYTIRNRRYIHMNPELSYKEFNTSEYISRQLKSIGIHKIEKVAGTGILASVKGNTEKGKTIVLRSELDALPIQEETGVEYASTSMGIMHACGHDAHSAMLLSVARALFETRERWNGNVYLLFQPGEELAPGGATLVLKEGVLDRIGPDAIIAQHVLPEMKAGNTGFRAGKYMASSDEIYIDIQGTGGHAALPGATDQVLIGSKLVQDLKEALYSYAGDRPLVFSLGKFIAEGATNIIPSSVHIEGTLRTFDEKLRSDLHSLLEKICTESQCQGVSIRPEIRKGYPVLFNNKSLTDRAAEVAALINGKECVESIDLLMSSEDFAYYSQHYPVLFYRIGVKQNGMQVHKLHSSAFNLYEPAMETGIRTMLAIALDFLQGS
jgi:amidohydrolase